MARLVVVAFADSTEATRGWGLCLEGRRRVFCTNVMTGKREMGTKLRTLDDRIFSENDCFKSRIKSLFLLLLGRGLGLSPASVEP